MKIHVSSRAGALVALMAAAIFGLSSPAQGQVFNTIGTLDGKPINASATFVTSLNQIQITLTNLQADPTSVIQAISDVYFTATDPLNGVLTGGPSTSALAVGTYINISNTGAVSGAGNDLKSWQLTNGTGPFGGANTYHLNALWGGGGLQGGQGLIIGDNTGATYPCDSGAGSICGNPGHNPFVDQTATFTLAITGATVNTIISNVVLSFGTDGAVIPIPAAVWLFISGLLGLIGIARRKQVAARSALPMPA